MIKSGGSISLCEPLRVSQLDASELDSHLADLLISQLRNAFKLFQPYYFIKFDPEIELLLKAAVWYLSINKKNATFAQQMFSLRYIDESFDASSSPWMSKKQKRLYLFINIILPWLLGKCEQVRLAHRKNDWMIRVSKITKVCELVIKMSKILSCMLFLTQGKQQFLMERFIGIRLMYPKAQAVRQISYESSEREQLWHGLAEFLVFLLPILNQAWLKRFIKEKIFDPLNLNRSPNPQIPESERHEVCPVCLDWPTNPHQGRCLHVFCYYCIASNLKADPGFSCPACKTPIEHEDNITQLPVLIDLTSQ